MSGATLPTHFSPPHAHCGIVPPYLLQRIAQLDDPRFQAASRAAKRSLMSDIPLRDRGRGPYRPPRTNLLPDEATEPGSPRRSISDCGGDENLPGRLIRSEGQPDVGDPAVNEAYTGLGQTYALYWERFGRNSIDGEGLPLDASVHYGQRYDNAFWDGSRMVFGDGDGEVFNRFTISMNVIGHELTHGVTQFSANLTYQGQSGALNESVSDVFGSLVEQHAKGQSASEASWLIGEGLFTDQVQGVALRSMKAPGTAYDDDVLGKDPQPATMAGYVATTDDNGGVHLNSGIPNRAFFLLADALGGVAWESPGQIWYDTLTGGSLAVDVDFAGFARATLDAAARRFGDGSREHAATREAWTTVGVDVGGAAE